MKKSFIFFSAVLLIISQYSVSQSLKETKYELSIEKFNKEKVRGETFWLVQCHLKNNSKDTLSYFSMSCSVTDFYLLDKKDLEIDGFDCDKNFPVILQIAPGETRSEVLRLFKSKHFNLISGNSIKIGLNIIETKSTDNFSIMRKNKNIIWSNSIALW